MAGYSPVAKGIITHFLRSWFVPIHCPGALSAGLVRTSVHAVRVARILIIDDDEPFRALLRGMLLETGHTVVDAANGFEALKLFRAEPADLVLTDLVMPYGGLATIRILRNDYPHLGIIAISGGGTFRLNFAQSLGAHRTLTKPFTAEQLSAAIAEVLSAHPAPKPGA